MHVDASPTAPRSVAGLSPSPTRQDVENAIRKRRLPKKVDWLDPTVVWGTAKKHFYSHLVSSYADTRPIQAFIDQAASRDTSTTSPMFGPLSETSEDMWIDFVADIGDGFDATYAIAYLIAQESLHLSDVPDLQLQAGQALIMGGDLAYPDATKSNYNDRCLVPYGWANPEFSRNGPRNPQRHLYCVAGNHDWYDGLSAFSETFINQSSESIVTRGNARRVGAWEMQQRRSYFALQVDLQKNWVIWGIDPGMTGTLDRMQRMYFEASRDDLAPSTQIILVIHEPVWLSAQPDLIGEMEAIAQRKVRTVLAGDLHHYARYEDKGPENARRHLITAGGGGAFLHATHDLPSSVTANPEASSDLDAAAGDARSVTTGGVTGDFSRAETFPSESDSLRLNRRHLNPKRWNISFLAMLCSIYLLIGFSHQRMMHEPNSLADVEMAQEAFEFAMSSPKDSQVLALKSYVRASFWHNHCLRATWVDQEGALERLETLSAEHSPRQLVDDLSKTPQLLLFKLNRTLATHDYTTFLTNKAKYPENACLVTVLYTPKRWNTGEPLTSRFARYGSIIWTYFSSQTAPPLYANTMSHSIGHLTALLCIFLGIMSYGRYGATAFRRLQWPAVTAALYVILVIVHFGAHWFAALFINAAAQELADTPLTEMGLDNKAIEVVVFLFLSIGLAVVTCGVILRAYWYLAGRLGCHPEAFSFLAIEDYKSFLRIRFEKSGTATIYVLGVRSIKNGKWRVANSGRALVEPDGWTLVPELVETIVLPPPPERSVSARS